MKFLFEIVIYGTTDHSNPVSRMSESPFYANFKVLIPICLSTLMLLSLIAAVLLIRKRSKLENVIITVMN